MSGAALVVVAVWLAGRASGISLDFGTTRHSATTSMKSVKITKSSTATVTQLPPASNYIANHFIGATVEYVRGRALVGTDAPRANSNSSFLLDAMLPAMDDSKVPLNIAAFLHNHGEVHFSAQMERDMLDQVVSERRSVVIADSNISGRLNTRPTASPSDVLVATLMQDQTLRTMLDEASAQTNRTTPSTIYEVVALLRERFTWSKPMQVLEPAGNVP